MYYAPICYYYSLDANFEMLSNGKYMRSTFHEKCGSFGSRQTRISFSSFFAAKQPKTNLCCLLL